ncbi:hypothetical protein Droror1_Dr00025910 [Drosera rotundifolia]
MPIWVTKLRPCLGLIRNLYAFDFRVAARVEMLGSRCSRRFSSGVGMKVRSCHSSDHDMLLGKLETALKENEVGAAMDAFNDFRNRHGYPVVSIVSRLIKMMSYSNDKRWLEAGTDLVMAMARKKPYLVHHDVMVRLCISLSRAQMPVPASRVLRLLLWRRNLPPGNALHPVFMHMVKSEVGTCLASNILIEICECFHLLRVKNPDLAATLKPSTIIFNLVIDACLKLGSSLKGKQVMEAMAVTGIGVVANGHSILLFARIYEMNFERDELEKFKDHIDQVSRPLVHHYRHYYGSLLRLHCKFNDVDAVASLIVDVYKSRESHPFHVKKDHNMNSCMVHIGSKYLRDDLKIQIMPESLEIDLMLNSEGTPELFQCKNGKLGLSNSGMAQVMLCYWRNARISDFSKLLVGIQTRSAMLGDENLCIDVIDACIHVGWLDTAHDIVDDMESAGSPLPSSIYLSLLRAYNTKNMIKEAKGLLIQIRRVGLFPNLASVTDVSQFVSEVAHEAGPNMDTADRKCALGECLVHGMDVENSIPSKLHELNSVVYFFCKAKMIEDALKTYRRMQELNVNPSEQTFAYLMQAYSSLGMYREITILWGDIKRNMEHGRLVVGRDLYEMLLLNFIRGGYFGRALEVIELSSCNGMFMDKRMCKNEFFKHHRTLYRRLHEMDAKDEVQRQRIQQVAAFRKWLASD